MQDSNRVWSTKSTRDDGWTTVAAANERGSQGMDRDMPVAVLHPLLLSLRRRRSVCCSVSAGTLALQIIYLLPHEHVLSQVQAEKDIQAECLYAYVRGRVRMVLYAH